MIPIGGSIVVITIALSLGLPLCAAGAGTAPGVSLQDEGATQGLVTRIDCAGAGISCSRLGRTGTLTVSGTVNHNIVSTTHPDTSGTPTTDTVLVYDSVAGAWEVRPLADCGVGQAFDYNGQTLGFSCNTGYGGSGACAAGTVAKGVNSSPTGPTCSAVADSELANNYSGIGACAVNTWASTLNDNAAATCTQPAFSNLSGTATDAQLANNYSGIGACAVNTWASTLNDNAAATCTQPAVGNISATTAGGVAYSTGTALAVNLAGTATTQTLHSGVTGVPTWSAVSLTADVSGTLPLASGGTNANLSGAGNGAVVYHTSTALSYTAVGSSGQCLKSAGGGVPTWAACATTAPSLVQATDAWTLTASTHGTCSADNEVCAMGVTVAGGTCSVYSGAVSIQATIISVVGTSVNYTVCCNNSAGCATSGTAQCNCVY